MADTITHTPDATEAALAQAVQAIDADLAQAYAEWQAASDAASALSTQTAPANTAPFSAHEVPGIGRYIVPRFTGWKALDALIHDPVANIDFSELDFPIFDDVISEHFNAPPFLDPADDGFPSYQSLRDNVAAVRNFLLQSYYGNANSGLTPDQASAALKDIAGFVGDGLLNNYRVTVLGIPLVAYHDPRQPFLSLSEARAKGGAGAQYIYEKILERQRRSDWLKPFDAVMEFFGFGKHAHWNLPPANATGFTDIFAKDLAATQVAANPTLAQVNTAIIAAATKVKNLEALRKEKNGALELTQMSGDLEYLGDHLLHTAHHMDAISALAKPVQNEAIAEARNILNKLKVSIGSLNILDGLKLKPTDDIATFGALQGVTEVFTRLLAWGRGVDPSILSNKAVQTATQAIGQLGYLAKLEALKMAQAAKNAPRVAQLSAQLKAIDARFATATDATFGGLLSKLENGISAIIEQVNAKNVSGASAAHALGNELGSTVSAVPTAGMSMQQGADGVGTNRDAAGKRNAELLMAEEAHLQQALQAQQQNAQRAKSQGSTTQATPSRPATGTGRVALQQAQRQQRQQTASTTTTTNPATMNAAQRQQQAMNASRAAHLHEEEQRHAQEHRQQDMARQQAMQNALKNVNMKKIQQSVNSASGLTTAPVTTNRAAFAKLQAEQAAAAKAKAAAPNDKKELPLVQPPPPPNKGGRGF